MVDDGLSFRTVRRGGRYLRVADPSWDDPLDGSYSKRLGGRWNAPGSYPVVYLNAGLTGARANVRRKLEGLPYGPEDLEPSAAPLLVITEVGTDEHVDVVTDEGCRAARLPASYPWSDGELVPWTACQAIGQQAWDQGFPGIACRSAAPGTGRDDEELAWFERDRSLSVLEKRVFDDWFWPPV